MLKQICSLPIFRLKIRQKLPRDCDKERDFMTPPTFSLLIPSLLLYWRRWGAHVLSPWERKTSLIFCTGCTGKSMVRWTDGENPMISGCSTSSITSLPSCPKAHAHAPKQWVQALCPHHCHITSKILLTSCGMKSPEFAGKTWRSSLETISNCVASAFSHSCHGLLACSSVCIQANSSVTCCQYSGYQAL